MSEPTTVEILTFISTFGISGLTGRKLSILLALLLFTRLSLHWFGMGRPSMRNREISAIENAGTIGQFLNAGRNLSVANRRTIYVPPLEKKVHFRFYHLVNACVSAKAL